MSVKVKTDKQGNPQYYGDPEGSHSSADLLPVLPQLVATIGQAQAPGEGAEEGVDEKLAEIHPRYPSGEADKGAYHR